jgi:hypothetical protein
LLVYEAQEVAVICTVQLITLLSRTLRILIALVGRIRT